MQPFSNNAFQASYMVTKFFLDPMMAFWGNPIYHFSTVMKHGIRLFLLLWVKAIIRFQFSDFIFFGFGFWSIFVQHRTLFYIVGQCVSQFVMKEIWASIFCETYQAPYKPTMKDEHDVSNFEDIPDSTDLPPVVPASSDPFVDWWASRSARWGSPNLLSSFL